MGGKARAGLKGNPRELKGARITPRAGIGELSLPCEDVWESIVRHGDVLECTRTENFRDFCRTVGATSELGLLGSVLSKSKLDRRAFSTLEVT